MPKIEGFFNRFFSFSKWDKHSENEKRVNSVFQSFQSETFNLSLKERIHSFSKTASNLPYKIQKYVLSALGMQEIHKVSIHSHLIGLLKELYGSDKVCDGGVCHGFALVGILAFLSEDIDGFNKNLQRLEQLLEEAQKKPNPYKKVIEDLKNNNDFQLLAFLEGIQLCMQGEKYSELVDKKEGLKSQYSSNFSETFMSMIASKEFEKKGKIKEVKGFASRVYTKETLTAYFQEAKANERISIFLTFNFPPHAISVGYDPSRKQWSFIDANSGYIKLLNSEEEIAKEVMDAYAFSQTMNERVIISDKIYAMDSSQKIEINTECDLKGKIETDPALGPFLLLTASSFGDIATVKKLIELKVDLNEKNEEGNTALHLSILHEHTEIALALIEAEGIDLTLTDAHKNTILHLAVHRDNIQVIRKILERSRDLLLEQNCKGFTALGIAVQDRHTEVVSVLIEKPQE